MTLADKRKVIEVLLCCSYEWSRDVTDSAAYALGYRGQRVTTGAREKWYSACSDLIAARGVLGDPVLHYEASTLAAYRLIESSATLRLEWFGVR